MPTQIKDVNGAREIRVQSVDGSTFVSGHGFEYEFDTGILLNGIDRAVQKASRDLAELYPPRSARDSSVDLAYA